MLKRKASRSERVTLVGHGLTGDGTEAVLVFQTSSGAQLRLVLDLDQIPVLARGVAHVEGEARREGAIQGPAPATPVDRWATSKEDGRAILTLQVLGGMELRFAVTHESTGEASSTKSDGG